MKNLFQDNAYNVLGLDTSVSQKDIARRSKEIINLLRIDEAPSYETDLNLASINRDEGSVKEAQQKLSSPTKRIKEYFFWFDIEDDNDEKALKLLKDQKLQEASDIWELSAKKETASGYISKKNLAILSSLLLLKTGQKKYLTQSLGYWQDVVLSDKFWSHFEKLYALNDEIGTSKDALDAFRKKVPDELSDLYTDISQAHKDNSFYSTFAKVFGVKGQKMERDVLSPIYESIHDSSEKLRTLNISEDNIISEDEVRTVKQLLRTLQDNFNKLKELGLYDDSQSKTMRDKASEALLTVALDIYNNLYESAKPLALLQAASKLAGTTLLVQRINKNVDIIKKNLSDEKVIVPINDLVEKEKFVQALDLIEEQMKKHKSDKELIPFFNSRIKWCVSGIAAKDFKECMQQFNNKKFEEAERNFTGLKAFILSYIHYFDFDRDSLEDVLQRIENMTANPGSLNIENVQTYRNKIIDGAPDSFKEQFEEMILVFLIDSSIYANLSVHLPTIRRRNTIKKWAWWIVIGIIFLIISAASSGDDSTSPTGTYDNSGSSSGSTSSSSSAFDTCKQEYDSLKSQLDSVEASMSRYEANDDVDNYNALVPRQNSLAQQTNAKRTECNNIR
jgi:hypothetical protein